jgi:hypothetical protein
MARTTATSSSTVGYPILALIALKPRSAHRCADLAEVLGELALNDQRCQRITANQRLQV